MAIMFSSIASAQTRGTAGRFLVKAVELAALGAVGSPVLVLDDFRVSGRPFPPHPHAGFSAVTYVFADSAGGLRSRDSLGNDVTVGAGGIVWTEAGSGVLHHEIPAGDQELHGLQLFVNLSAANELCAPRMLHIAGNEVPEWTSGDGDRVRVVVGAFNDVASPLVPTERFTLLDVTLRQGLGYTLTPGHVAIIYVVQGGLAIANDGTHRDLAAGQAIALRGDGRATLGADGAAQLVIMSGPDVQEPIVVDGPFIMSSEAGIAAAHARYRAGGMGRLAPL
ncbi:pirin family protein [Bradyrhizobium sp. SRS-191]|uniref:pirin family protein n=1 Tax=Bradyrhizobium sp. SRS-191 TaxID=2962606 RepID=UPI00211EC29E|nr:pirin family protein [Bradyrhizobium sp. SRS-191]